MISLRRHLSFALLPPALASLMVACGARTGFDFSPLARPVDAGIIDATVPMQTVPDAAPDAVADTAPDSPPDAPEPPVIDANFPIDAAPPLCTDASAPLVYAITQANSLLRFDPSTSEFTRIGTVQCNDPNFPNPFSMAVGHEGVAFVLYSQQDSTAAGASVYRVSLETADCSPTTFDAGSSGFYAFGMGFSTDDGGESETLYVASYDDDGGTGGSLGEMKEPALDISVVAPFSPPIQGAELSGTGDGRLFAFFTPSSGIGSSIAELNKGTAALVAVDALPSVQQGGGWAFSFWGGDFYLFTAPYNANNQATESIVTRFTPSTGATVQVADYPEIIVGAGASTCAPVR